MKYSTKQYASVLLSVLADKSEKDRKEVLRKFVAVLAKNRDLARLGAILRETEREYLRQTGMQKVLAESASPIDPSLRKEIEHAVGGKIWWQEKVNPELLAGIKILINGETLIDASGKRQIEKMFA